MFKKQFGAKGGYAKRSSDINVLEEIMHAITSMKQGQALWKRTTWKIKWQCLEIFKNKIAEMKDFQFRRKLEKICHEIPLTDKVKENEETNKQTKIKE
jgi:hypothetical protein